jgi:hypothetical protein
MDLSFLFRSLLGIFCCLCHLSLEAKGFVTAQIDGQLGNQMFQIAAAYSLAQSHHAKFYLPNLATKDRGSLSKNCDEVFWRFNQSALPGPIQHTHYEPHFHYAPIAYRPNMTIQGYFQSEKYFKKYKKEIRKLFGPSPKIQAYLQEHYSDILNDPKAVSIHFRNYAKESTNLSSFYGTDLLNIYYLNARSYIAQAIRVFPEDTHFIVFSDDIPWCKQHLADLHPNIRFMEGESYIHDFYLISSCSHHIISNSSFSWWAAYLNPNSQKVVVAPKDWFQPSTGLNDQDLCPPEWIRLPSQ